jgi:phosphoribosylformimino-5-aminoimidazole carboxamide ribotide isomerase
MVATDGWADVSAVSAISLAQQFEQAGVSAIVYTDIARDGMMQGVNVAETAQLARSISIPVIASGGVTNMQDIENLYAQANTGIMGAILGRSIYEGTIDLADAQRYVDSQA